MAETFDVFLSYNSKDKETVREIKERLIAYGLSPWLDEDKLRPGSLFQDGLEQAILASQAAAIFVGEYDLGPWQRPEAQACLDQAARRNQNVIPVFLPGAPEEPNISLFLRQRTRVDLRDGITDDGIERLVWGITGEKPKKRVVLEGAPDLTPHFRGRQAEVEACLSALRSSRLLTIVGLPGAGKTELSLAAAQDALADPALRPQRALWFSLAGVRNVDEIASRLALAFQVSRFEKIEEVAAAIGAQRVLLVLDNAEDLIVPARLAFQAFCGDLLRLCPGLRLLLTSRRRLGDVSGCQEAEVSVGRLHPPLDLEVFCSAAADRITPEDRASADLKALVAALEGHPLSLVLLAGQAGRSTTLATLRRRLEQDGDAALIAHELLGEMETDGTPDELLRTKRLISSLNLSFAPLLSSAPGAAEIFLWLGHLPAGLRTDLVPVIFGEEGEKHVALLLSHNLVEMVRDRDTRLLLPAPVRWYAKRRLAEMPTEKYGVLLVPTFRSLGLLLDEAAVRSNSEHTPRSLSLALREEPNLASLLPEALRETAGDSAWAKSIADALVPWCHLMSRAGRPSAALRLAEQAAAAISAAAPGTSAEARFLGTLGDLYERTDRLHDAESAYQSALTIFQQIEDRFGEASARKVLGDLYVRTARLRGAEDAYQSALTIFQQIEDRLGEASTRKALGDLYVRRARLRDAEDAYQSALTIFQQIEDRLGEANTQQALGDLYFYTARLRDAEDAYQSALTIFQQIKAQRGEANTLQALGDLFVRTTRLRDAEDAYQSALPIFQQIEDRRGEANTLQGLGKLAYAHGDPVTAFGLFLQALAIQRSISSFLGEGGSFIYLARTARATNHLEKAIVLGGQAWKVCRKIESLHNQRVALDDMAACFASLKDEEARRSSMILAWHLARTMEEPSAEQRRDLLRQIALDFDPEAEPAESWLPVVEEILSTALERYEQVLADRGEDPLAPLPAATSPLDSGAG